MGRVGRVGMLHLHGDSGLILGFCFGSLFCDRVLLFCFVALDIL